MTGRGSTHETFVRPDEVKVGSERSFGLVFAGVFAIIAGFQWWGGARWLWWFVALSALFAMFALAAPRVLRPLNILWFKFGLLLHGIISPAVLGLMFFTVFTPIGWCMRLMGKRPLNLPFDRAAPSYWIERKPPGPPSESFKNQF